MLAYPLSANLCYSVHPPQGPAGETATSAYGAPTCGLLGAVGHLLLVQHGTVVTQRLLSLVLNFAMVAELAGLCQKGITHKINSYELIHHVVFWQQLDT